MTWVILFFALIAAAVLVAAIVSRSAVGKGSHPYVLVPALFTPAERSFLGVLDQAVGKDFRVLGKVRVADVVNVVRIKDRSQWQRAFNRISAKHFDFVVCRASDYSIACVVELDDRSHQNNARQKRDTFLDEVCEAATLRMIRIPARRGYSVQEVEAALGLSHG